MAASRETVMQALFDLLKNSSAFVTVGRRLVDPEGVAANDKPAFFLIEHEDEFRKDEPDHPLRQIMTAAAFLYIDTGTDQNAIPGAQLNAIVDGFIAALKPDNPVTRRQTLGGLVHAVWLSGQAPRASGDVTGKGMSVVPIKILLP